jgi:hypothetical protein
MSAWAAADHICSSCCGRILRAERTNLHRCANCGRESQGSIQSLCCCGATLASGRDAGIRCVPNPNPGPMSPAAVVAREA